MADAIESSREAFSALASGAVQAPMRTSMVDGDRTTLLMGASSAGVGRIAKVANVFPGNGARGLDTTTGVVMVIDEDTGQTIGLCDGGTLTAIRTGAVAGLATDLLARSDAEVGAVLGAGGQARTQLLAMAAVRPLREIRIYAPRPERIAALIEEVGHTMSAQLVAATSSQAAVEGADIISSATSSMRPTFDGGCLRAGAHINGIGSFRLDMRELDALTIQRANQIVVDLRESALHEAGELVAAAEAGHTDPQKWVELGSLIEDPSLGRTSPQDITLFKSVGHAVQDLFAARRALENAERLDLGQCIEL